MRISAEEDEQPEVTENPEEVDGIVQEEYNDFLGGEGEHEELDTCQDVIEADEEALVPGGLDVE